MLTASADHAVGRLPLVDPLVLGDQRPVVGPATVSVALATGSGAGRHGGPSTGCATAARDLGSSTTTGLGSPATRGALATDDRSRSAASGHPAAGPATPRGTADAATTGDPALAGEQVGGATDATDATANGPAGGRAASRTAEYTADSGCTHGQRAGTGHPAGGQAHRAGGHAEAAADHSGRAAEHRTSGTGHPGARSAGPVGVEPAGQRHRCSAAAADQGSVNGRRRVGG